MSTLIVGISHASAPISMVERVVAGVDSVTKLLRAAADVETVSESALLATCNRVELYAEVDRFHGSVEPLSRLLIEKSGFETPELLPHLYVHYDQAAVAHLFAVAAGLDSVAVGEAQILGQVRSALKLAQDEDVAGPSLNVLFQQALRVGKRAHAETDLDQAAPSLVAAGLDLAAQQWPDRAARGLDDQLAGLRVLVVGAGSMASLAVATAAGRGASITVANRSLKKAERLAAHHGGSAAPLGRLPRLLGQADIVMSCVGATGVLIEPGDLPHHGSRRVVVDLALPRDVDPAVGLVPGLRLFDLASIAEELRGRDAGFDLESVRDIVAAEVRDFRSARHQARVTPTVVALRAMADEVVDAEMARLESRLSAGSPADVAEIRQAMRRVADKLVHQPTVQVRRLTGESGDSSYADALAALFALDPVTIEAMTRPEVG